MPFDEGMELLESGVNSEMEDKLFMRWIAGYQFSVGYTEFKKMVMNDDTDFDDREIGKASEQETLDKVKAILDKR